MSEVSAVDIQRWSGQVKTALTKYSVIVDEMMEIHDLNNSEDVVIPIVTTGEATEFDKKDSRLPGSDEADTARRLSHNPSMEINDHVWWEDKHRVPYDHIDKKSPLMAQKTALGFARRFVAWGVKVTADGGGGALDHILQGDYTTSNAALTTLIINSLLTTRQKFVEQGLVVNAQEFFVGLNPFLFGRLHTISEIKGREFRFDGMGGVRQFKAFEYGDMTLFELPVGLGENVTTGNLGITAKTPAKFTEDLTNYTALAWWSKGAAAGFINGGDKNLGFVPDTNIPVRHINYEVEWYFVDRRWVMHTDMIFDLIHVYVDGGVAAESDTFVAWLQV